jgi:hypothetical protein
MGLLPAVAVGMAVGSLFALVGIIIATTRAITPAMRQKPSHVFTFATSVQWDAAMRTLLNAAPAAGYAVAEVDMPSGFIMLSQSISLLTWGFFLPVYVSVARDGRTMVEVGIRSKLYQRGPIVRRSHLRCFEALRAALGGTAVP